MKSSRFARAVSFFHKKMFDNFSQAQTNGKWNFSKYLSSCKVVALLNVDLLE
jgi:hypothetical protein